MQKNLQKQKQQQHQHKQQFKNQYIINRQDPYINLSDQKLLKQVYYLDVKNRQLQSRIAQLQPYKQRIVKIPPNQKQIYLFNRFKLKKYALKIAYIGIYYNGMALQPSVDHTIQQFIFKCMHGLSLIQDKTPGTDYTRAGRTDKGVSAYGNVIALKLRTSLQKNEQATQKVTRAKDHRNGVLDYAKMLNSILPNDIRIMAVKQVDDNFSARYNCYQRSYKYFFCKNYYDMQKMKIAIKKFIGTHNFVNFCKIDVTSTMQHQRTIFKADIQKINQNIFNVENDIRNQIYCFHFVGNSFLWHQIRFMVTILFLIGSGKQQPQLIQELMDIEKYPHKPNYPAAPQYPLILEDCKFKDLQFQIQKQDAINFYSTFNDVIMKKILELTIQMNCVQMTKNSLFSGLKINQKEFIQKCQQVQKKVLKKKQKKLQFQKSTCINKQQAIANLKGKKLQLFEKKNRKQMQYQERVKQTIQKELKKN